MSHLNQHALALRVYYEDTDFSGFVYHASYLRFLERGRTEFLRAVGIDQSRLHREDDLFFVVARLSIDYLRPARMDDLLTVHTSLAELRGPVMKLDQTIVRDMTEIASAKIVIAALRGGRPVRLPASLRAAFGV